MLLSLSTKPLAKQFMKKYIDEIMPQITSSGKYISSVTDQKKIDELNKVIDKLRNKNKNLIDENIFLDNKYRFKFSKNGYFYINKTECIINGNNKPCFKFGVTDDIENRYKQYKVGNSTFKMICYLVLDIDKDLLEGCVKNITKAHLIKKNNESGNYTSLKELKEVIISCIDFIKNHVCNCLKCKRVFKFKNLDNHKCNKEEIIFLNPIKIKNYKSNSRKGSKKITSRKSSKK